MQTATFGGGCFWCTEAVFQRINGVISTISGYAIGENRTNGHAEAVQIEFDESVISFNDLLEIFFVVHDPTTLNRQMYDIGEQYRSVIFAHDEEQLKLANEYIEELEKKKKYNDPIVTEVTTFDKFTKAEDDHQNFYNKNSSYSYCQIIINPKLTKLFEKFGEKVKEEYKS